MRERAVREVEGWQEREIKQSNLGRQDATKFLTIRGLWSWFARSFKNEFI